MNELTDWIAVDESRYDEDESRNVRSVVIHLSVSPYDVPHHVRGGFDKDKRRFVIQFRYIDDEPTHEVRLDEHAQAIVGKRSNRVYSIELDVGAMKVEAVGLRVELDKAISELAGAVKSRRARESNYALAKKVIGDNWAAIAKFVQGADSGTRAACPNPG